MLKLGDDGKDILWGNELSAGGGAGAGFLLLRLVPVLEAILDKDDVEPIAPELLNILDLVPTVVRGLGLGSGVVLESNHYGSTS